MGHANKPAQATRSRSFNTKAVGARITFQPTPHQQAHVASPVLDIHTRIVGMNLQDCSAMSLLVPPLLAHRVRRSLQRIPPLLRPLSLRFNRLVLNFCQWPFLVSIYLRFRTFPLPAVHLHYSNPLHLLMDPLLLSARRPSRLRRMF